MSNSAEKEIEEFLASLPAYKRKEFELGISALTQEERVEYCREDVANHARLRSEYERLLRLIPAKFSEYIARESKANARALFPANPAGRPRKDDLAEEAALLKKQGLSYAKIALRLNRERGEGTTTKENVRGLLKSRSHKVLRAEPSPDDSSLD